MKKLISELSLGRDAAAQLQVILNGPPPPRSDQETCEQLVQNVLSSYEKVLAMLNSESSTANTTRTAVPPSPAGATFGIVSSSSLSGSPHSEDSDRDGDGSRKKRKAPRWTQKVKVCKGSELEGNVDDGYSWRKYGQKEIHGTRYPRAYFRCAHRHTQGCLATKHVQRSDEDPNIFDITFRGKHACKQFQPGSGSPPPPPPLLIPPQNQEPIISPMES
ncbi:unnamed protein product, partial [Cuscuta europaea]